MIPWKSTSSWSHCVLLDIPRAYTMAPSPTSFEISCGRLTAVGPTGNAFSEVDFCLYGDTEIPVGWIDEDLG